MAPFYNLARAGHSSFICVPADQSATWMLIESFRKSPCGFGTIVVMADDFGGEVRRFGDNSIWQNQSLRGIPIDVEGQRLLHSIAVVTDTEHPIAPSYGGALQFTTALEKATVTRSISMLSPLMI